MHTSPEMQSAWTQYWKSGPPESMPLDRASGLLGELDQFWEAFFAGVPDGARLLDLATGGGDVIRKAIALNRDFELTGVDIADLPAGDAMQRSPRVRLIGNTDLSNLPLPDASFDGVTSQFGFEYADMEAASGEAIRVLAPRGRGCFVLHHADSAMTHSVSDCVEAHRSTFAGSNAFQCGRAVFELCLQSGSAEAIAEAKTKFRNAVARLQARLRNEPAYGSPANVVGILLRLASAPRSYAATEGLRQLEILEKHNEARNLRQVAQTSAALDRQGIGRVVTLLKKAGANVEEPKELRYPRGKILAWGLSFQK